MQFKFREKFLSYLSLFSILIQTLSPLTTLRFQSVYAQDVTPTETVAPTPLSGVNDPLSGSTPTPEATVSPTQVPTEELSPTPTEEITPSVTPIEEISPTVTVEPSLSPTDEPPPTITGPPSDSVSETPTETPSVDVKPTPNVNGHVDAKIVESDACFANSLNGCLTTDKKDYAPTEVVIISGYGFAPNTSYELTIISENLNQSFVIQTDDNGAFNYSYQLDGTYRPNYTVELRDLAGVVVAVTTFTDSNPSADLDQYANLDAAWVNGNLGASKASYFEGDSVPYRMKFGSLTLASHTITFEWDTTKSSKHALDYLTTFNRSVPSADPCTGVSGCSSFNTFAIPADSQVTGAGVTPIAGLFRLYGGTITGVSAYSGDGSFPSGDNSRRITITFTASVANPVLAWGGHIATRGDWGVDNAAVNIPGSPYHMRLIDLDGAGGNQDRSLSAEAVIFPGSITIIKDATPNGSTSFPFTATPTPLANFNLVDDGTSANTHVFSNITNFQTYSVSETVPSGWTLDSINCSVTSPNGGSQTVTKPSVSINLKEGENVTCTFNDSRNQVAPTITTAIHNPSHVVVTSVPVGTTVHDSTSVTGSLGTATGNVTFNFYNNGTCSNTPAATSGTFALSGGSVDATGFPQGPLNAGSYSFKAHYAGDINYTAGDSACEPLTVTKANPGIQTTPNPTSGSFGAVLNDSAVLSSGYNPTGNIVFSLYSPSDATCQNAAAFTNTVSVSGNGTYNTSSGFTSNAVGTWHWKASYSGDSNNNSVTSVCADEPVTIGKLNSSTVTEIHNASEQVVTSVDAGTTVHDKATVSGSGPTPTGNVNFTFYSNHTCSGDGSGAGTIALVSGVAHPSSSEGPLNAGSYSFKAHYNGDGVYNPSDAVCEPLAVNQLTPTVVTEIHKADESLVSGSVALGTTIHDKATVSGSSPAVTGSVNFRFYSNNSCSGDGSAAGSNISLVSGVAHPSSSEGPLATGFYSFKAHYNGDTNYVAGDSACEPLTVNKSDTTTTTQVHNPSHQDVTNGLVPLGTAVHDSATVGTQVDSFVIGGTVTYHFFTDSQCEGDSTDETAAVGNESSPTGALATGSYSYRADYNGDVNYHSSTGACEPFSVGKATPTVATEIHDSSENVITSETLDFNVHDKAAVSGIEGFAPTGNVDFTFYTDNSCEGEGSSAGSGISLVSGVAHPSDTEALTSAGHYSFQAHYNGDDNYAAANSECEPFTLSTLQLNKNTVGGDETFDYIVDGPTNSNPSITTSGGTGTSGAFAVLAGDYSVSELAKAGWKLTDSSCTGENSPDSISLPAGSGVSCTFDNEKLHPLLTISKSNNASGDKAPGDNVTFTLTVTATQSAALNVVVTDLPAEGFTYRSGSWTASKNGLPFSIPEPVYHSPGKWQLGNLNAGDVVVLTYIADISGSIAPGLYPDVAWAAGCDGANSNCSVGDPDSVLASAVNPGKLSDNFVGTKVNVVKEQQNSTSVNIERGEVLGVSLPATGGNTLWLLIASLFSLMGMILFGIGLAIRKKWNGKNLAVLVLTLFAAGNVHAANLSVRLEEPKSPTNVNSFKINFVSLDIFGRPVTVKCMKKGPSDGGFSQFGLDIGLAAGGGTGSCEVNSSVMSNNGTYLFIATATAGGDSATSETEGIVSVDYNTSGPGTPYDYKKEQVSLCEYKLTFRSADDGGKTIKIEIYRSDKTSFPIDPSTRVGTVGVSTVNQLETFNNTVPDCGKTWYYAIRAYESAGNGSGVIGDSAVTTTIVNVTTAPGAGGAIPVAGVTLPAGGEVLGEKAKEEEKATKEGEVKGEEAPTEKPEEVTLTKEPKGVVGALSKKENRPLIIGLLVVIIGGVVAYVFFFKKGKPESEV